MRKKILLCGNTSWSMYNFRRNLILFLQKHGYSVAVMAPYDEYSDKIKELGCEYYNIKIDCKGINPIKDLLLCVQFYNKLIDIQPDICIFYTIKPIIYGCIVSSWLKIKNIAITTGLGHLFSKKSWVSTLVKQMYRLALIESEKVFFLNRDDSLCFVQNGIIDIKKAVILNGEGIDTEKFIYTPCDKDPFVFLLISRILWSKGVGVYVDAARIIKKKYPNVEFQILGFIGVDNPEAIPESKVKDWVDEGIINYLGTTDDVKPYINKSTSIVLPSFYGEGIPFTLLEGASMCRPLIATDNVGCKDVVDDSITGFLCEKKSVASLVDAMLKLIELPIEDLQKMGCLGRLKIEREFHQDIVFSKYKKVLDAIVE